MLGSSLGFLGLGVQPPAAEWGVMIAEGQLYLATAWWISRLPGHRHLAPGARLLPGRRRPGQAASWTPRHDRTPLLTVDNLAVEFETAHGPVSALQGVSFSLSPGEVLGIVGESGSGKTVACRSVMRLLAAMRASSPAASSSRAATCWRSTSASSADVRGERIAMIFQNPSTHLDPLMTVGRQVGEALQVHHGVDAAEARRQSIALLADMRIPEPERRVDAYAHQLSGGMRQRVMIAAALACKPSLLLADEPTTALDVTVQAQILDLLKRSAARARPLDHPRLP